MIHTKELRFGNKVMTRQGLVITIQQLLCNTLIYDSQIELKREAVQMQGSRTTDYITALNEVIKEVDYAEIVPIALSSELLQQCGFRNYRLEQWILSIGNKHLDFEFINEGLTLRNTGPSLVTIKWLHQLQNFIFALVGHDLQIAM
jgi:hypothetical protein